MLLLTSIIYRGDCRGKPPLCWWDLCWL